MDRPSSAMGLVWTLGCTMLPGHCRHPPIHARVIIGELTWEAMRNAGDEQRRCSPTSPRHCSCA
jgi:hypothetical protein